MPPVFGHIERHHDEMGDADADFLQATRAQVLLARLEGVDECNLQVVLVVYPRAAHNTSSTTTTTAAITIT